MGQFITTSIVVFLITIFVLVILPLVSKKYLSPSGKVKITINGDKETTVDQGSSTLSTLNENGVFLPSTCGGKGSCDQCKLQVVEGGGEILDSERPHFSRKDVKDHWRLGCQCKVKGDMSLKVPESIVSVKEWECTVISNKNISSFIKELKVVLPPSEHMDFVSGSYAQISIPAYNCIDYDKDFDKNDIDEEYLGPWKQFNLFSLKRKSPEPIVRAYSMASYPAEGDIITLIVRIAAPPFLLRPQIGLQNAPTGIGSTYTFFLKEGDKAMMSGPYGDFHPNFTSGKEMIWIGGGASMAPLRVQIIHMIKTPHTRDREMHFFYGACLLGETFFLENFWELEKEYLNLHFHLSLDRLDLKTGEAGVKYYTGFAVNCIRDEYLQQHEAPEDCEYYLCGPPMLIKTVTGYLGSIGVNWDAIMCDSFG